MSLKKAAFGPALALAVLVGCQGGDAADAIDATATSYETFEAYGEDPNHPITALNRDALAHDAETELERLVNDLRISRDLPGLRVSLELRDLALAHSIHMGRHEPAFFDHVNPEGDSPKTRVMSSVDCVEVGENIAAGQTVADAVFRSWLDSPGHLANLLDPKWTHMGAGHAFLPDSPYVTYWTLDLIEQR